MLFIYYVFLILLLFFLSLKIFERFSKFWFAWFYEFVMDINENAINASRERTLKDLKYEKSVDPLRSRQNQLRILEIGPAGGRNLRYYPKKTTLICVEPNQYFRKRFEENLKKFTDINLENFFYIKAENIEKVEDESIDIVVGTYILCSVSNIEDVLKEIKRILVKGGKYYYIEHVADENKYIYLIQRLINPFWKLMNHHCQITLNSGRYIRNAGFQHVSQSSMRLSLKLPVQYSIYGIAIK